MTLSTPSKLHLLCRTLLLFPLVALSIAGARADDGIFPPAAAAKASIDFDGRGFLINGNRTFIVSGSIHYSRVPRPLWRDRLLRLKRAGFNTVQTYAFWNYHEPQEGRWNFSGDHDFEAFLKLVKELGLYAVVRPGPYVCAEWDSGGYPVWLRFKPGVRVREDNPQFLAAVDAWYDKILPIIARNQIHRGGAVIMVQLENEHPLGWGREMPNGYFRHLRTKAIAQGIEVPYFFSGLHHGSDPAGDNPWDSKGRDNPWYSTEFWPGWYDLYGPLSPQRLRFFDRGTWKILAYGGNGYNFYMLHGGTDFDTYNDDEVASSYDYGAAIGQAGDLRPIYYRFKRAALFARSFANILEDSENASDQYKDFAAGTRLRVTARKSPAGTILFLDNNTDQFVTFHGLTVEPGEIAPLLRDYKLLPDVTLVSTNVRILGVARQGDTITLVVYGPNIGTGGNVEFPPHIEFKVPENGVSILKGYGISHGPGNPGRLSIDPSYIARNAMESTFAVGKEKVRVLAVTEAMADHTWFVETGGKQYVVGGPAYVGEVEEHNGTLHLVVERGVQAQAGPYGADYDADVGSTTGGTVQAARADFVSFVYGPQADALRLDPAPGAAVDPQVPAELPAPALAPWQMRRGDAEAAPNYRPTGWKASANPLPMGADGDDSAYAWYRATVTAPRAGDYVLDFSDAGDWLTVFVNGRHAGSSKVQQRLARPVSRRIPVTLRAGKNTVAVLTAHYGRQKLFNFLGPIGLFDAKGLSGPVHLTGKGGISTDIARWRMSPMKSMEAPPPHLDLSGNAYKDVKTGDDIFHGNRGLALYCVNLEAAPGPHRALHFENVDDNATVYLNGRRLAHHEGWGQPFDVPLDSAWNANGPNQLAVVVENIDGVGGIMGAVTLEAALPSSLGAIRDWQMRGGLGDTATKPGAWSAILSVQGANVPTWYRTEFNWTPPAATSLYPILRVSLRDLSRGFVWLNGHNLGRYPEKVPVDGLYLPECWLKPGRNTLLVYDEVGRSPSMVHLTVERAASRVVTAHTAVVESKWP